MGTPVILDEFNITNQFSLPKLNSNFQKLVGTINSLAAETLVQLGTSPGGDPSYMPITGGSFYGQITAPSMLVGPVSGGTQYPVVTTNDAATSGTPGAVKQAAAVADLGQTIAGPSIAEVQAISDKVDALLAALRTAGVLAP